MANRDGFFPLNTTWSTRKLQRNFCRSIKIRKAKFMGSVNGSIQMAPILGEDALSSATVKKTRDGIFNG